MNTIVLLSAGRITGSRVQALVHEDGDLAAYMCPITGKPTTTDRFIVITKN